MSSNDEEKEVNRLHKSLGETLIAIRDKKSEFTGVALIIGSGGGGEIQTSPKFLGDTIKKFYIDPGHFKCNENKSISPIEESDYIISITTYNSHKVQSILPTFLKFGIEVFIYDNCEPMKFGQDNDFSYSCAKNVIDKTDPNLHKNLHVVIGYFDDYPSFLVENEFFITNQEKKSLSNFIQSAKKEGANHYEIFLNDVESLDKMHIKMYSDDNFNV